MTSKLKKKKKKKLTMQLHVTHGDDILIKDDIVGVPSIVGEGDRLSGLDGDCGSEMQGRK